MREAHYNAFPSPDSDGNCNHDECGLSKLEYFAGLAMQGLCVNTGRNGKNTPEDVAESAVKHAKAILIELEKES